MPKVTQEVRAAGRNQTLRHVIPFYCSLAHTCSGWRWQSHSIISHCHDSEESNFPSPVGGQVSAGCLHPDLEAGLWIYASFPGLKFYKTPLQEFCRRIKDTWECSKQAFSSWFISAPLPITSWRFPPSLWYGHGPSTYCNLTAARHGHTHELVNVCAHAKNYRFLLLDTSNQRTRVGG